jgi:hypothetical protein
LKTAHQRHQQASVRPTGRGCPGTCRHRAPDGARAPAAAPDEPSRALRSKVRPSASVPENSSASTGSRPRTGRRLPFLHQGEREYQDTPDGENSVVEKDLVALDLDRDVFAKHVERGLQT